MIELFSLGDWPVPWLIEHIQHGLFQGSLVLLLVFATCRMFRKISPDTASWLWRLGFIKYLVAFCFLGSIVLEIPTSVIPDISVPAKVKSVVFQSYPWKEKDPTQQTADMYDTTLILTLLYRAGFVLFGLRLIKASYRTRKMRKSCQLVEDHSLLQELDELCVRMGIHRAPQLLTGNVGGALICGFVSPCVVLPENTLEECNPQELRLILAHELAHMKRRDVLWGWLPMLAQWIFFFNPVVWLVRSEWIFAQEAACDLMALNATNAPPDYYARMLLTHATKSNPSGQLVMAGVSEPYYTLKRRLCMIANSFGSSRKKSAVLAAIIILLGLTGVVPWMIRPRAKEVNSQLINIFKATSGGTVGWSKGSSTWDLPGEPHWRWHFSSSYHKGLYFQGVDTNPVEIYFNPANHQYIMKGKVEIHFNNSKFISNSGSFDAGPPNAPNGDLVQKPM